MHMQRLIFRVIPVLIILTLLALPIAAQDGGNFVTGEAIVSSIEIGFGDGENTPVVSIIVRGDLPDGCTRLSEFTRTIEDRTLLYTLTTTRPADAACTQSLVPFEETFAINVGGLSAGTYTVVVNGVEASFRLTSEMVRSAIDLQGPEICGNPEPGLSTYVNGDDGICFLFPDSYTVTTPEPGLTVVTAPEDVTHTVRPTLTIAVSVVEEQTLEEVIAALAAEHSDIELVTSDRFMQARPAIIVENIPGDVVTRQVFTVRFGVLYHVTVQPTDATVAGSEVAENLWTTVVDSLRFVEVDTDEAGEPIVNGQFTLAAMDELGIGVVLPGSWSMTQLDDGYGLVAPDSYGFDAGTVLVTFNLLPPMPMDSMENFGLGLQAYYEEQGESGFQLVEVAINFRNSVLVVGLEQSCLTAVIPTTAGAASLNVQDVACNEEGILEDPVILNILNSVQVLDNPAN